MYTYHSYVVGSGSRCDPCRDNLLIIRISFNEQRINHNNVTENLLYRANMEIFACLWTDDLIFFLRQGSRDGQVLLWGVCLFL